MFSGNWLHKSSYPWCQDFLSAKLRPKIEFLGLKFWTSWACSTGIWMWDLPFHSNIPSLVERALTENKWVLDLSICRKNSMKKLLTYFLWTVWIYDNRTEACDHRNETKNLSNVNESFVNALHLHTEWIFFPPELESRKYKSESGFSRAKNCATRFYRSILTMPPSPNQDLHFKENTVICSGCWHLTSEMQKVKKTFQVMQHLARP